MIYLINGRQVTPDEYAAYASQSIAQLQTKLSAVEILCEEAEESGAQTVSTSALREALGRQL